jgi:hypothetical protein
VTRPPNRGLRSSVVSAFVCSISQQSTRRRAFDGFIEQYARLHQTFVFFVVGCGFV